MEPVSSVGVIEILLILIVAIIALVFVAAIVYFAFIRGRNKPTKMTGALVSEMMPHPPAQQPQTPQNLSKRCPQCQSVFTDTTLQFCLTDGARLESSGGEGEYETVVRNHSQ